MNDSKKSNWRFLWVIPILALTLAAIPKILSMDFMVQAMESTGLQLSVPILGIVELLCVIIFLFPKTRNIGFLLTTAFIGGIIAVGWAVPSQSPVVGIILEILLWAGMHAENHDFFEIYGSSSATSD